MPYTAPIPLTIDSALAAGDARLTELWKITRTDATVLRFTSWDAPVEYQGDVYTPAGGVLSGAREIGPEVDPANQQIIGVLTSGAITLADLLAGKYDDATVDQFVVHAGYLWAGAYSHQRYTAAATRREGDLFYLELSDLGRRAATRHGSYYTKECIHQLGGADGAAADVVGCRHTPATYAGEVSAVPVQRWIVESDASAADGVLAFGYLTWASGANTGLVSRIEANLNTSGRIRLLDPTPFPIEAGDTFTAVEGCPKTFSACKDRFSQVPNFGGYPYIPGNDRLFLTPDSPT